MRLLRDWETERKLAIADAEAMRETHIKWRDHIRECAGCQGSPEFLQAVGDESHHEECIDQYDRIIRVLNYARPPAHLDAEAAA